MTHRAFTLVELLVVISILALLMALSFPVLMGCRQKAKTIACCAHIRQLLLSLQSYEAEHQSLPYGFDFKGGVRPPGGYVGNPVFDGMGWWWFHSAGVVHHKSLKELDVLRCPSSKLGDPGLAVDPLCSEYGVNRSLCKTSGNTSAGLYKNEFVGTPASISNLHQPGSTLLIVDSGYSLICWWNATADPPVTLAGKCIEDTAYIPGLEINKNKVLWPGQSLDAIGGRHPNKTVNIGFADGHAGLKPASDLLVEKEKDGCYTNTVLWQGQ
jgi:prepilin-type N-terminal cleavage/methylation domain-containing protein/prepilin-type processing-associated H-X9-DG protein